MNLSLHDRNFVSDVLMSALATGCHKLETLNICRSNELTNGGLAVLAVLPNLTKLYIAGWSDLSLSVGVTAIALQGRLVQFMANNVPLSAVCLKTIVRHCRYLELLDVGYTCNRELTMEDAIEIVHLYGTWGMEPRLMYYSSFEIWQSENVREVIEETHQRHFDVATDY